MHEGVERSRLAIRVKKRTGGALNCGSSTIAPGQLSKRTPDEAELWALQRPIKFLKFSANSHSKTLTTHRFGHLTDPRFKVPVGQRGVQNGPRSQMFVSASPREDPDCKAPSYIVLYLDQQHWKV